LLRSLIYVNGRYVHCYKFVNNWGRLEASSFIMPRCMKTKNIVMRNELFCGEYDDG